MRFLPVFLTGFALSTPAWAAGKAVEYKDGDTALEGYWADSQCEGAADPFVPQDEVKGFMDEMDKAGAGWTLTQYAGAVPAFTRQGAGNDVKSGAAYNEKADTRSWAAALNFLDEISAK